MKIIEVGAFFSYSYTNLAEVTLPVPQAAARSIVGPARAADDRVAPAVVAEAAPAVVAIPVNGPVVVEGASLVAVVAAWNSFFFFFWLHLFPMWFSLLLLSLLQSCSFLQDDRQPSTII